MTQTWQGLQGLLKGLPADKVPTAGVDALSDAALSARINSQLTGIDNNAALGRKAKINPDGPVEELSDDAPAAKPGARQAAISTLKTGLANPATMDMMQFHALLAAYSDGQQFTIPDFGFDNTLTDAERTAAEQIVQRLEAGQNAPEIRAAFGEQAATVQEQQRVAAEQEAARIAAEQAAARQQANLETGVDAHLAAAGYIKPDQIGALTDTQRANWVTQFMKDKAMTLTNEGSPSLKHGGLGGQHRAAIDLGAHKVQPAALDILNAGRRGDHMAEEVKSWLESGDENQIKMAQATIGVGTTGRIDAITHSMGEQYIQAGYAPTLKDIPGIQNVGGNSINPSLTWQAANEGRLYIPSIDELRAAGVDEATLESIEAAPTAAQLLPQRAALEGKEFEDFTDADNAVWAADTREELVANAYIANPKLYETVIAARNELAAGVTLDVAPPINIDAPDVELDVVDVAPEDATPLEVLAAANNPLGLRDDNPEILGDKSSVAGNAYTSVADGKTADGTLVFNGPDTSLQMVADHIRPAEGALSMEEAMRRVYYIQTSDQQMFLGGAMGSNGMLSGSYAARVSVELGYEPRHVYDMSDPKQMQDLLTGAIATTNYASLPGEGNILERFKTSDDPSVVAMRESIERVANGTPLLGKDEPAAAPEESAPEAVDTDIPTASIDTNSPWADTAAIAEPVSTEKGDRIIINTDGSFNGSFKAETNAPTAISTADDVFNRNAFGITPPTADPERQRAIEAFAAKRANEMGLTPGS